MVLLLELSAPDTGATVEVSSPAGVVATDVALADVAQPGAMLARTITLAPNGPNGRREWSGSVRIILKGGEVAGPREHPLRVVEADPPPPRLPPRLVRPGPSRVRSAVHAFAICLLVLFASLHACRRLHAPPLPCVFAIRSIACAPSLRSAEVDFVVLLTYTNCLLCAG